MTTNRIGGWAVEANGPALNIISGNVPAGAFYLGGAAYTGDGARYCTFDAIAASDCFLGGLRHTNTGALRLTLSAPAVPYNIGGFVVNADGQVFVSYDSTAIVWSRGFPFAADGSLRFAYAGVSPSAYDYDGTNDYTTRGGNLTGLADGKQGTFSGWVRVDALPGGLIFSGAPIRFAAYLHGVSSRFSILAANAADSIILDMGTANAFTPSSTWRHFLASWDLTDPNKRHIYINDVSDLAVATYTNDTIDYTPGDWSTGALAADGTLKFNGCMAELFFHPVYIDLSVEANRRKFITAAGKPAFLGTTGAIPLGVQPILYAPNGNPSTNAGSGGNFTVTGALDVASSTPFTSSSQFAPLQPHQLSDNAYSTNRGYYYDQTPLSRLLVTTDATSVEVEFYVDPASYGAYPTYMGASVWDGTTRTYIQEEAGGFSSSTVALAAGVKTVEITSGIQLLFGGSLIGSRLTAVRFNGGTFATRVAGATSPRIVVYGDSIATGFLASEPPNNGWTAKLRQLYAPGSVMLEAWGSRGLRNDGATAGARQVFADRLASYTPTTIWLAAGIVDYLLAEWTAASFQTAYADLLDKLHATIPGATIYAQSPVTLSAAYEATPNALGDLPSAYRTAVSNACSGRAWATFVDGMTFILTTDLTADDIHPNTTGHNKIYLAVRAELGL